MIQMAILASIVGLLPQITSAQLAEMVGKNLVYHAPQITIPLDHAAASPELHDLEQAGILEQQYVAQECSGTSLGVVMTDRGQQMAFLHGWMTYRRSLIIPAGSLEYVASSGEVLEQDGVPAVTFKFKYQPGANAPILLSLGPAADWEIGDGFTLADAGKTFSKTLPLELYGTSWSLPDLWSHEPVFNC